MKIVCATLCTFFAFESFCSELAYKKSACYKNYKSSYREKFLYNYYASFELMGPMVEVYEKKVIEAADYIASEDASFTELTYPEILKAALQINKNIELNDAQKVIRKGLISGSYCNGPSGLFKGHEIVGHITYEFSDKSAKRQIASGDMDAQTEFIMNLIQNSKEEN